MTVLVTGGAGYIGSHVVEALEHAGHRVVVVDDLSTGSSERVDGVIETIDLAAEGAAASLAALMQRESIDSVIHLAAKKQVGESVAQPLHYYRQNIAGLAAVLEACSLAGVGRFVFSSSAAVYGTPDTDLVDEQVVPNPINPYGRTKLAGEWLVRDMTIASPLRAVALRYFNVAGAARPILGDSLPLNLVTIVLDRARRGLPALVYGDDFATPDGSGVRDFVHVADLARAHVLALDALDDPRRAFSVYNVGTGVGASVLDVIAQIGRARGRDLDVRIVGRRAGDPPTLVADPTLIGVELGWRPEHDLSSIIDSAVAAFGQSTD